MDNRAVTQIVCYTGGTCGDLITAMIDVRGAQVSNNAIRHDRKREKLKKPHLFGSDDEKDRYLIEISCMYDSIPSHDLNYHLDRGHDFITVVVRDQLTALWAAERFKKLHRPHVWEEMQKSCGADSVEDYAKILIDFSNMVSTKTTKIIRLEKILSGDAVKELVDLLNRDVYGGIYQQWLANQ
jgi:hypothetical protein